MQIYHFFQRVCNWRLYGNLDNHRQNVWEKLKISCKKAHHGKRHYILFSNFVLVLTKLFVLGG